MSKRWVRAVVGSVALGLTAVGAGVVEGCSGTRDPAPMAQGPQHAAQVVGKSGGAVTTPSGAGVAIPAGAVPGDVTITVDSTPSAAPPSGGRAVGTPYTFGPEGTQFAVPVTVTLDFDATLLPPGKTAKDIYVYTAPAGTTAFTPLETTVIDASHVSAQTSHFSVFVSFVPSSPPTQIGPPDAGPTEHDASTGEPDAGPIDAPDAGAPVDSSAGDDGSTGTGGTNDGGASMPDASGPITDASAGDDGGVSGTDAGTGNGGNDGGASYPACTPQLVQQMLKGAIAPPSYGFFDWSSTSVDAAQAKTCAGTPTTPVQDPNDQAIAWGANGDLYVEYGPSRMATWVRASGAYAGALTTYSRKSGAYGNHTYVIAMGAITRDGAAFDVPWGGQPDAAITELFDAYLATFLPQQPAAPSDCVAAKECTAIASDAHGNSVFSFHTSPVDVSVASSASSTTVLAVSSFYAAPAAMDGGTSAGDASAPAPDAGCSAPPPKCAPGICGVIGNGCGQTVDCGPCGDGGSSGSTDASAPPPADGGGACVPIPMGVACSGVCGGASDGCGGKYVCPCDASAPPSDASGPTCYVESSKVGSCANHPAFCTTYPGTTPSGCTDHPPSGYDVTCCTP